MPENQLHQRRVVACGSHVVSHLYANPANRPKLKALAALGVDLTAVVPERWESADGNLQNTVSGNDDGVAVVTVPVRIYPAKPSRLLWNPKVLRQRVSDSKPELVHIEEELGSQVAGLGVRLARRLDVPGVLMTSESLPPSYSLRERLRRDRNLRLATGVIGTSSLAVKLATKRRPSIPHTVVAQLGLTPPNRMPRERHSELAIGFVGRLVPERGLDLLFRACVGLAGKWTLTVVGTGPSQEELEELAQRLGISARISWLGALPRQAVDEVWSRLDCLVLPSRTTERWIMTEGRAAVHAMANGVAVVGTNSGALPEIVGEAGRIVPEEDVASDDLRSPGSLCRPVPLRTPGLGWSAAGSGRVFRSGNCRENAHVLAHIDHRNRLTSGDLRAIFAIHALSQSAGLSRRESRGVPWAGRYCSGSTTRPGSADSTWPAAAQRQNRPDAHFRTNLSLLPQLRQRLLQSGLTPDQVRSRLRAAGYPENMLDEYLTGADTTRTVQPGQRTLDAVSALGLLSVAEFGLPRVKDSTMAVSDSMQQVLDSLRLSRADSARADSLADSIRVLHSGRTQALWY